MSGLARGELDRLVRIERPIADTSFDGAGSGKWELVEDNVWAGIKDVLPSRAERLADGLTIATRPARVRMDYRPHVTSDMRFVDITDGVDGRVMQIVAGPADIGRRDGSEFMVEDYSMAGNPA
ncbi:head-tail adaptor protein [uncultured Sphingomonas sp.]|uniref:head-tail adaptor protein n=1 Tax=uncultured Sphingomonas sp. TaxID=158754 RepID=UPI0025E9FACB|nr:head-tail adaptor protein [uncultured Sphingomonas sp.]